MVEEFECDCCGTVLTKSQMKIEKRFNKDISPCFCNQIISLDKKNKKIKKLKEYHSEMFDFLSGCDLLGEFEDWCLEAKEDGE